ncbi:hypothetical protein [Paenibacillus campi]|uniref:hypothetical protein n=1 Tax=Paenibacillus campi TaxID=3106031 RepID=UPI002AFE0CBB|nr:hypothetical protein [Paenibacillus sp. SGZ-1014]
MRLQSDRLSITETLKMPLEKIEKFLDDFYFEYQKGDYFFLKDTPDQIHIVADIVRGDYRIVSENGSIIDPEDAIPIFSVGTLIEILSTFHNLQLSTFFNGWFMIWELDIIMQSEENDRLVTFLWRILGEIIDDGKFIW